MQLRVLRRAVIVLGTVSVVAALLWMEQDRGPGPDGSPTLIMQIGEWGITFLLVAAVIAVALVFIRRAR
jgi:hypothetical protein